MKIWHVYELVNSNGIVEYVGETINPYKRWYNHKCKNGKFHNRNDIKMNTIKQFDNHNDAYVYQCVLQKQYGFITDSEKVTITKIGNKNCVGRVMSESTRSKMREARLKYLQNKNI